VQCLAEQVVTSVLQPSVPPAPVAFSHERKEADLPSNKESGLCEANALIQTATAVDDHEIEVIKLALIFPLSVQPCVLLSVQLVSSADFYCN